MSISSKVFSTLFASVLNVRFLLLRLLYSRPYSARSARRTALIVNSTRFEQPHSFGRRSFTNPLLDMFTPPPSPGPTANFTPVSNPTSQSSIGPTLGAKKRTGRQFRRAVIIVPLVLMAITISARLLSLTPFSPPVPVSWHGLIADGSNRRPHRRHPLPEPQMPQSSSSSSAPSTSTSLGAASSTGISNQITPTVPSSPPPLPTPFPQPFDGNLAQNFSSVSCFNFFGNMTNTQPFRACRPFSLLLQSSDSFINAQQNLTLLNSIIWGTCNTSPGVAQCAANMGWFAASLKTACAQDLKDQNSMAVNTLAALQAFQVMHDASCLADPTTNTYCFLTAVRNPNPSDLYYYQLPLSIQLPKSSTPSCSACTKSVMGIYAAAIQNSTQAPGLAGLKATYQPAAELSVGLCGAGYAKTLASSASKLTGTNVNILSVFLVMTTWTLLVSIS